MLGILKSLSLNEIVCLHASFIFSVFDNFEDMQKALLNKTVTGIMDEMYHGLYWMRQVRDSKLYVVKMIERTRSYGFAFKKNAIKWPVDDCVRKLILYRTEDVYSVMKKFKDEMKVIRFDQWKQFTELLTLTFYNQLTIAH